MPLEFGVTNATDGLMRLAVECHLNVSFTRGFFQKLYLLLRQRKKLLRLRVMRVTLAHEGDYTYAYARSNALERLKEFPLEFCGTLSGVVIVPKDHNDWLGFDAPCTNRGKQ